jgi:hypothetical protein
MKKCFICRKEIEDDYYIIVRIYSEDTLYGRILCGWKCLEEYVELAKGLLK